MLSKAEKIEIMKILLVIEDDLACGNNLPLINLLIKIDKQLLNEFLKDKRE